jgi:hypothetical protein
VIIISERAAERICRVRDSLRQVQSKVGLLSTKADEDRLHRIGRYIRALLMRVTQ